MFSLCSTMGPSLDMAIIKIEPGIFTWEKTKLYFRRLVAITDVEIKCLSLSIKYLYLYLTNAYIKLLNINST